MGDMPKIIFFIKVLRCSYPWMSSDSLLILNTAKVKDREVGREGGREGVREVKGERVLRRSSLREKETERDAERENERVR